MRPSHPLIRILGLTALTALVTLTLSAQDDSSASPRTALLQQHVFTLASDSLRGRASGSDDARRAADYILAEYQAAGVEPLRGNWQLTCEADNGDTYLDIVGVIPGYDPSLSDEYILLGAHYDHLGVKKDSIYNGANDNASGSAALIEVARLLCSHRDNLRRSIIIAAFDGEETGLHGSDYLSNRLKEMGIDVRLMMSIDMVGWLAKGGSLKLEGTGTIRHGKDILTATASTLSLPIRTIGFESSILTATDTQGFALKGIPTLAVTTGLKSPYHKPGDDAELIDYNGLELITRYLADVTMRFASDPTFAASGRLSFKHRPAPDKSFEVGPTIGFNTSSLHYPDAAFEGVAGWGYNGGIALRSNMRHIGLIADVWYTANTIPIPDATNLYTSRLRYRQTSVTVPVNIVWQSLRSQRVGFFAGIGGYYSHTLTNNASALNDAWSAHASSYGSTFTFGLDIYNITLRDTFFTGFGDHLTGASSPSPARFRSALFTLTWYL